MTSATLTRRLSVALLSCTLLACGDSTGPTALNEEQVNDMMDAIGSVNALGFAPGVGAAVVSISETGDCPNGGTMTVNGTADENEAAGTGTAQITQTFNGCKTTSSSGRVWTFNGNPNIVTNLSATFNQTTEAFTLTGTQVGGVSYSSDVGSGSCSINISMTMSGTTDSFSGSISGTVCGRSFAQSVSIEP